MADLAGTHPGRHRGGRPRDHPPAEGRGRLPDAGAGPFPGPKTRMRGGDLQAFFGPSDAVAQPAGGGLPPGGRGGQRADSAPSRATRWSRSSGSGAFAFEELRPADLPARAPPQGLGAPRRRHRFPRGKRAVCAITADLVGGGPRRVARPRESIAAAARGPPGRVRREASHHGGWTPCRGCAGLERERRILPDSGLGLPGPRLSGSSPIRCWFSRPAPGGGTKPARRSWSGRRRSGRELMAGPPAPGRGGGPGRGDRRRR